MSKMADLQKLLGMMGIGTDLNLIKAQLVNETPVDQVLINNATAGINSLKAEITKINAALSGGDLPDPASPDYKNYAPVSVGDGTTVYWNGTGAGKWALDPTTRKSVTELLQKKLTDYGTQVGNLEGVIKSATNAPLANADATIKQLQAILLNQNIRAEDRAAALADAKAARDERSADAAEAARLAGAKEQKGTIAHMIVQDPTSQKWYFRQFLKDGTFTDSEYNPSDADRAKALYNAPDGSIGSIGADGTSVKWTYRPPRLTKEGEYTYSTEFDPVKQDYVGAKTTISSPGQKLEMYNGQLYITEMKEGKISVTKVKDMPTMSEKDRQELEIASRNSATAEKNQLLAAAESGVKVETAQFALDQAREGKQTAIDILNGKMTVIQGLIKSGTSADLAKAQELYQSARKDWEVEKKNATERRDKAQDKGLRRSGMMFLRGATAVQGGKTGAEAQKMWKEEYNRTPGKEGETYTERMARSLGLGADLDQNLDTTFPSFTEYANGVNANVVHAKTAVPGGLAPGSPSAPKPEANGRVPIGTASVRVPGDITATANVRNPIGLTQQTGITDAGGNARWNTVDRTGRGPGDVAAQPLFQGQVAVAPSPSPSPANQTGLDANGQSMPMQVPVAVAPDAPLAASWKQYTPENYQNIQGSTQQGDANVGDVNVDGEDPYAKLTRIHAQLNGFSAE